ncbi:RNA polymerase sigma-70 factor (ECF subfamily) [Caldicoprobacter guelmensis]|uniref:RNA polymerase sigma factor SigZ n=1 Tax=Caldicoprobacter guelmensis TaxID=1170224 RepID=UPI001957CBBE|nr:RNA polymerase sigma factor SigZ [Caldicoprobacter guelmensis]MBM7582783.1 RNA polymerase sigma-70 factor (ECF subfamily) [Caldicoprobacter guelmensis]
MSDDVGILWEELSPKLKTFILKKVGNRQDAEDILQDVFLKICSNIDQIKDSGRIYAWIYQITRNTIADYYRAKRDTIEISDLSETDITDSDEGEMINELVLCLKSILESLPGKYKQAVKLTELGGLTQKELARKLGMSISGAKSRVQRGKAMLKKKFLECCKFQFDVYGNIIEYQHKEDNCKYC